MESSIARHLVCPRTRTRRIDDDYAPLYPAWSARTAETVSQVVMGYFGVQSANEGGNPRADAAFNDMRSLFDGADGPNHVDYARFVDGAGAYHRLAIVYWSAPEAFDRWQARRDVTGWWQSDDRLKDGVGYFREVLKPRIEQFETAYSTPDHLEGVGVVMGGMSDVIQEHGYWGSMRDRIPLSQTDAMSPSGALARQKPSEGRIVVSGHKNVAVIRSGQDWTDTADEERRVYLDEIEPTLRAGMEFLRDQGQAIGCYSNRYVEITDAEGRPIDKSFGVSHWRSLADMERWAESHPTHLKIFMTFVELAQNVPSLRLYHEVSVLDAAAQTYEYINCHPGTGLMHNA
ncbi:phenylacetaldoxime dehydratase family protein [Hyphomicrobium sp.]|uniref:phenylacetaldoxime dehydratase family protein n=1 Tax=Hyphomicrobium sp. TaxID=82 RepID=UPI0025B953AF|nr:phenylacetaldoxime dehydratase family protein [Hyphomicrobium sp.]MCC7250376.1 phenylacetaldoxime dehydratase family protein [Hyphomicrobium sp.]